MVVELIERLSQEAAKRGLDFLIIGGQAMMHHGYQRLTIDVDFLGSRSMRDGWEQMLSVFGYSLDAHTSAFDQFKHPTPGWPRVDIMYVDEATWCSLSGEAEAKAHGRVTVRVPSPRHMVALKLHSAVSPTRAAADKDWTDIATLVRKHRLDLDDPQFAKLVVRYGGEEALQRLKKKPS